MAICLRQADRVKTRVTCVMTEQQKKCRRKASLPVALFPCTGQQGKRQQLQPPVALVSAAPASLGQVDLVVEVLRIREQEIKDPPP